MVQINWTIEAVSDLKEIAMYISKDSQYYAKLQIERLRNIETRAFKGKRSF